MGQDKNDILCKFEPNSVIFMEGDPAGDLYIIKSGVVKLVKESDNRLIPLATLGEKSFIGEAALFDQGPQDVSAITGSAAELIRVDRQGIQELLNHAPPWVSKLMRTLADRLRYSGKIIKDQKIVQDTPGAHVALSPTEETMFRELLKEYREQRKKNQKS